MPDAIEVRRAVTADLEALNVLVQASRMGIVRTGHKTPKTHTDWEQPILELTV